MTLHVIHKILLCGTCERVDSAISRRLIQVLTGVFIGEGDGSC